MKKFYLFIIFLFSLFFLFFIFRGKPFSKDLLKLEILGPEKVSLGEDFLYIVKYKNLGEVRLIEATLLFQCPKNSLKCELLEDQSFKRISPTAVEVKLADIYPGQERKLKFKSSLMGKEGALNEAVAEIAFRAKGLSARYSVQTSFLTIIKKIPLTFDFDLPQKIVAGGKIEFSLNYFSRLNFPLSNLSVKISWPEGFQFLSSSVKPNSSNDFFSLPYLEPLKGGKIKFKGILTGEIGQGKVFKARLQISQIQGELLLKETEKIVELIQPSVSLVQLINHSLDSPIYPKDRLNFKILFKNLGDLPLENEKLKITLSGPFDFKTLSLEKGVWKKEKKEIIFFPKDEEKLKILYPGEEGEVNFSISLLEEFIPKEKGGEIISKIEFAQTVQIFKRKISSKLSFDQKAYFEEEFFGNFGPLPPKVGKITTYTIIWTTGNCCNLLEEVKIRGKLPQEVSLTGKFFPEEEGEKIFFDSLSRELLWTVGRLNPGQRKTLAFQIAFAPTLNLKGKKGLLIKKGKIEAKDSWTHSFFQLFDEAIDTSCPDDPSIDQKKAFIE